MKPNPTRYYNFVTTPLGRMVAAASANGIAGLWFEGQRYFPDPSAWVLTSEQPLLVQLQEQLNQYFARQRARFELALDLSAGTAFQQSVWRALCTIPYGASTSYQQLGRQISAGAQAARAVGAAVGRNPMSVIVPCHRVLGSQGALTGYAGGLERKTALLKLEGQA